ncbi:MAG: hypothetical protein VW708_00770 [Ilumatobacter sp.]
MRDDGGSRFRHLARTHAAMMAGEAAMVVALADSFFFDVDLDGTRTRLLGFLLVSFTPFLIVAPMIGPMIDRVRGGRRFVVRVTALARLVIQVTMIWFTDDLLLFPLVFIALVLQKTYAVSKSAIVPSVVRNEAELVEANSKLGLIAGLVGAVAVVPAAALQFLIGSGPTLAYGAALFALALWWSMSLPASSGPIDETAALRRTDDIESGDLRTAWVAMLVLRSVAGFTLFHLALWYRGTGAESWWLGAAVGAGSLGTMFGNAISQTMRRFVAERNMLAAALVLDTLAALAAIMIGGELAGVVLAGTVNLSAAIGRLAFESIVQRDGPETGRGQTFARYETRFQFGWVVGATLPVLLSVSGTAGFVYLAAVAGVAAVAYVYD